MAIQSFSDSVTERFFYTGKLGPRVSWTSINKIAKRKLDMLHYATKLLDLQSPPGSRLEILRGNLADHYSIRINDQWRIIFCWMLEGPTNVRIADYH